MQALLTKLKNQEGFEWLNNPPISSLQLTLRDLDTAFKRYFEGISDFPNFKRKYFNQSAKINNILANPKSKNPQYIIQVDLKKHKVLLPKLGWLNFYRSSRLYGKIINATISKDPDGKYYISFTTKQEKKIILNDKPTKEIGIDLAR